MSERAARPQRRKTRQDWVDVALTAIAEGGVAAVAVEPLAARLGTTKGSFYWHFPNRGALLEAALEHWAERTTTAILREVESASYDPRGQLRLLIARVVAMAEEDPVGPALLATATHPTVAPVLQHVTRTRVDAVIALFAELGFPADQARARALLAYSAYLGHTQIAHSTPELLPKGREERRLYLDQVLRILTAP